MHTSAPNFTAYELSLSSIIRSLVSYFKYICSRNCMMEFVEKIVLDCAFCASTGIFLYLLDKMVCSKHYQNFCGLVLENKNYYTGHYVPDHTR
ncbi:unnamed protein product [Urochloa humidicola]